MRFRMPDIDAKGVALVLALGAVPFLLTYFGVPWRSGVVVLWLAFFTVPAWLYMSACLVLRGVLLAARWIAANTEY